MAPTVTPVTTSPTPEILDIHGVARFLRVAERSVIRWRQLRKNPLPGHKLGDGRRIIFIRDEVIRWVASHRDNPSVSTPRAVRRPSAPKAANGKRG